jgi:hypothetical protein
LEAALSQLQQARGPIVPVLSHGHLVGAITLEQIDRFVTIQSALQRHADQAVERGSGSISLGRATTAAE